MRKKLTLLLLITAILSCKEPGIEQRIGDKIKSGGSRDSVLKMVEVTNFKWNKMFVFKDHTNPDTVTKIMGRAFFDHKPDARLLVFKYQDKVVYTEYDERESETLVNGQVDFELPEDARYVMYTPENAVFRTEIYGDYYILRQLK